MGLDLEHVAANERHHGEYVCALCEKLTSLDAVITFHCSHPFCRRCLDDWLEASPKIISCDCPRCGTSMILKGEKDKARCDNCRIVSGWCVGITPMAKAQPLAHRVLGRVKVICPNRKKYACMWVGDYENLLAHLENHQADAKPGIPRRSSMPHMSMIIVKSLRSENRANGIHGTVSRGEPRMSRRRSNEDSSSLPTRPAVASMPSSRLSENDLVGNKGGNTPKMDCEQIGRNSSLIDAVVTLKDKASLAYKSNHFAAARDLYSRALDLVDGTGEHSSTYASFKSTLLANRAISYHRMGNALSCVSDADEALRLDPSNSKAYLRMARGLLDLGRAKDACDCLQRGIKTILDADDLMIELNRAKNFNAQMSKIEGQLKDQDYLGVKESVRALGQYSTYIQAQLMLAHAECGLGNAADAMKIAETLIMANPKNIEANQIRGYAHFLDGNIQDSLLFLNKALKMDPGCIAAEKARDKIKLVSQCWSDAREASSAGDHINAVALYSGAIRTSFPLPPKATLYLMFHTERAEAKLELQLYLGVLADTALVLAAKRDYAPAMVARVVAYQAMGRHPELLAELRPMRATWGAKSGFFERAYALAKAHQHGSSHSSLTKITTSHQENYYEILGVSKTATQEEIRRQYLKAARLWHPDRYIGKPQEKMKEAERRFQLVVEGMETLCDEQLRQLYDEGASMESIRRVATTRSV
jgi:tetratricopeptide (TPR) repeat protein